MEQTEQTIVDGSGAVFMPITDATLRAKVYHNKTHILVGYRQPAANVGGSDESERPAVKKFRK